MEPERGFSVVQSGDGHTHLGHLRDYLPRIENLKEIKVGTPVKFVAEEINIEGGTKKVAKLIRLMDGAKDEDEDF